jgi:hypothetical protein
MLNSIEKERTNMSISTELHNVLSKIIGFFTSGKAKAALTTASELVSVALPIVQEINVLVPNKTVSEVVKAYQKYGVPVANVSLSGGDVNSALLNLATAVLQKNLPAEKATASVSILQTAIQLAVLAAK